MVPRSHVPHAWRQYQLSTQRVDRRRRLLSCRCHRTRCPALSLRLCVCVCVLSESLSPFYRDLSGDHFPISMSRVLVFLNFCCVFISQSGLVQSLDAECVAYGATGCIAFTMLHLVCTDILFNIIWVMLDGAWIADIRSCFFWHFDIFSVFCFGLRTP